MVSAIKFFRASSRERLVVMRSFVWVAIYRTGLWVLPFSVTKKWTVAASPPTSSVYDDQIVREVVRGVRVASRLIPHASCLTQALAARKLLRDSGQVAELKIGVAKSSGDFEAHAWLEIDGRIVLGKQNMHSRYVVLGSGSAASRILREDS